MSDRDSNPPAEPDPSDPETTVPRPASAPERTLDEDVVDYVRANRDVYTRPVMRERLIAAGHPADAVDAVLDAEGFPAAEGTRSDLRPRAAAIATGTAVLMLAAYGLYETELYTGPYYGGGPFFVGILAVTLGIAYLIGLALIWASRDLRAGVEGALVGGLVVPVVLLVGVFGICIFTTVPR